jgi:guanine deaminase
MKASVSQNRDETSTKNDRPSALRGRALCPHAIGMRVELIADALLEIDSAGRLTYVGPAPADCTLPESFPGAVLLPGFVDAHIHFPQTRIIGSASGPLLDWLERSVFPEESRFADRAYAAAVAQEFTGALVAQGTTCAAVFSSSHPGATDELFMALDRRGLRALAGLTLMDRGLPGAPTLDAATALAACDDLRRRWHGHDGGRLRVAIVPRFALSCSPELLAAAGAMARQHELFVHTHISENRDEVRATLDAFPGAKDYLDVYERHGLVGERSLLAHAIWLSGDEWDRVARHGAAIAHCPDSNFFLGSGCMPLREPLSRDCRVGLGSDMGAGRTFSMRRVASAAYDASLVAGTAASPETLLWLATAGGARALGLSGSIGHLLPGYEADIVAVDAPPAADVAALFDALLFHHDAGPVRAAYVRGRRVRAIT